MLVKLNKWRVTKLVFIQGKFTWHFKTGFNKYFIFEIQGVKVVLEQYIQNEIKGWYSVFGSGPSLFGP